jgi:hypothetical protein
MHGGGFEVEHSLNLARSPEAVFELLTDTAHFQAVDPALVDHGPRGRLSPGSTGWFRHRRGGMTARTTYEVTGFDPSRLLEVAITGMGYQMTETASLESTPAGTRVRFVDRVWPTNLPGRLLVALSGGIMRRDLRARAGRLRDLLERD